MRWDFHGITVEGLCDDAPTEARWRQAFAPRPSVEAPPDVVFRLTRADRLPTEPESPPDALIRHQAGVYQLKVNLVQHITEGLYTPAALATPETFANLLAAGLLPHLQHRGLFPVRGFAVVTPPLPPLPRPTALPIRRHVNPHRPGVAILLGHSAEGADLALGLALLRAGWNLLSPTTPLLTYTAHTNLQVLAYPHPGGDFDQRWLDSAPPAAILFPHTVTRADHALELLTPDETLALLTAPLIHPAEADHPAAHLLFLNTLVANVPAFRLHLGPDLVTLPALILDAIDRRK